jgi:uncharacterized protein YegP (UPF0339 family)
MKFVIFRDVGKQWLWELKGKDDTTIARSANHFAERAQVIRNINALRRGAAKCQIFDMLGGIVDGDDAALEAKMRADH